MLIRDVCVYEGRMLIRDVWKGRMERMLIRDVCL